MKVERIIKIDIYTPFDDFREECVKSQSLSYNEPIELMRLILLQWEHIRDYIENNAIYSKEEETIKDMLKVIMENKTNDWKLCHFVHVLPYGYKNQLAEFYE